MSTLISGRSDSRTEEAEPESWTASWRSQRQSRVDIGILSLTVVAFGVTADLPGIVAGLILALSWRVLPNVAVFAAGIIALVALVPSEASLVMKGLPVIALSGLVCTTTISEDYVRDSAVVFGLWAVLSALLLVSWTLSESLWITAIILIGLAGTGFIGIAVFGLKQLGALDNE